MCISIKMVNEEGEEREGEEGGADRGCVRVVFRS